MSAATVDESKQGHMGQPAIPSFWMLFELSKKRVSLGDILWNTTC